MAETHLSSLVVHARPDRLGAVCRDAEALGCEVHAAAPEGKLIVTLEAEGTGPLRDAITRLQQIEGVLAATLAFHHVEGGAGAPARPMPERRPEP